MLGWLHRTVVGLRHDLAARRRPAGEGLHRAWDTSVPVTPVTHRGPGAAARHSARDHDPADQDAARPGTYVELLTTIDPDPYLHQGHPGRVIGVEPDGSLIVSWVNGPTICLHPRNTAPLGEAEHRRRGQRMVALRHRLRDEPIDGFTTPGQEWH